MTPEQRADKAIAQHGPYCDKLGYERASEGWRNCITQAQAQAGTMATGRTGAGAVLFGGR